MARADLEHRNHLLADLLATGMSAADAGGRFGISGTRVNQIARSPLFQALVTQKRKEISDATRERYVAKLIDDAADNVDFLIGVRSNDQQIMADEVDRVRLRMDASKTLLSVTVPKRTEQTNEHAFTLRIEASERTYLDDVAREAIDITPTPTDVLPEPVPVPVPIPVAVATPDETAAALDARALAHAHAVEDGAFA
jgi:hypothetical protein